MRYVLGQFSVQIFSLSLSKIFINDYTFRGYSGYAIETLQIENIFVLSLVKNQYMPILIRMEL